MTEAFGGEIGSAAASSYALTEPGRLAPISASVGDTRSEVCWAATTRDGRFVYVTNFGDGTISSYTVGDGGNLELLEPVAASSRLGTPGIRDEAISRDGRFLYAIDADAERVFGWTVGEEGGWSRSASSKASRQRWQGWPPAERVAAMVISRGFRGRRRDGPSDRVPPGQYLTDDFPVLSAGPTPHTPLEEWTFSIEGGAEPVSWTWDEFRALPSETFTVDIHCVTRWSKLDTVWEGISVDTLLDAVEHDAAYAVAFCDGGYTTNLPLEDLTGGKAWVAFGYDGEPLEPEHGGPARLLVPHLYFWKSAKWVRGLGLRDENEPGFWESNGYHLRGDPWLEQRYWGD